MATPRTGLWINYDFDGLNAYQFLVRDETAIVISNAVAVSLALVLPRLHTPFKTLLSHTFSSIVELGHAIARFFPCRLKAQEDHERFAIPDGEIGTSRGFNSFVYQSQPIDLGTSRWQQIGGSESRIMTGATETMNQSSSPTDAAIKLFRNHLTMPQLALGENLGFLDPWWQLFRNMRHDPKGFTILLALSMMFLAIIIGEHAASLSSSFIIGNSLGVPRPGTCGVFVQPTRKFGQFNEDGWHRMLSQLSMDSQHAVQMVDQHRNTLANTMLSHYVFLERFNYTVYSNTECPFQGGLCFEDGDNAISMDTGRTDSTILGINTYPKFQWRRQMTCAPLVSNSSYMNHVNPDGRQDELGPLTEFTYFSIPIRQDHRGQFRHLGYNSSPIYECGDSQINNPNYKCVPQLNLDYLASTRYEIWTFYSPQSVFSDSLSMTGQILPEFQVSHSTTSIISITPMGMLFASPSLDPIFQTEPESFYFRNSSVPFYLSSARSTPVLGCTDRTTIYEIEKGREFVLLDGTLYDITKPLVKYEIFASGLGVDPVSGSPLTEARNFSALSTLYSDETLSSLHLLSLVMYRSSASTSLTIGGNVLDASQKLINSISSPLHRQQWKVEALRLFEISLAQLHLTLGVVATGRGKDDGFAYNALQNYSTDYCAMAKVHMEGYKNVSVVGLAGMMFLALSLWVLTMETGDDIVMQKIFSKAMIPFWRRVWSYICWAWCNASGWPWHKRRFLPN